MSLETRCLTMINVLLGCLIWKAIWCGEKVTLLPLVTFSSTVKKCPESLYPNRSGVPRALLFSILVHLICGVFLLISCQNFVSFLTTICRNWFVIISAWACPFSRTLQWKFLIQFGESL